MGEIPAETIQWLTDGENPAVTVLTRRDILGKKDSPATLALWDARNEYEPVARILGLMRDDGSWAPPNRDYRKYEGNLWQIILLGQLHAAGDDERTQAACEYGFSRQLDDGSWSCNGTSSQSIPCLTANVGLAIARMGQADDERIVAALRHLVELREDLGYLGCAGLHDFALNGYCHMVAPKILRFLAEVPRDVWPDGTGELRNACVEVLRDKEVFRSLPREFKEYKEAVWPKPKAEMAEARERFLKEHTPLHYDAKPGWLRLGFPLSYNSDALESLAALAAVGEKRRPEYEPALSVVCDAADDQMRWKLRNSFNGKMLADVEVKGEPSRWLTLRALGVLDHYGELDSAT